MVVLSERKRERGRQVELTGKPHTDEIAYISRRDVCLSISESAHVAEFSIPDDTVRAQRHLECILKR